MKRLIQKTRGVIRGTSSAVLLSAGFHIILLLIASTVVVVKIVQRQDARFNSAQVNRPKMDLKKLRVKVKDSSKPRKAVERIVSSRARSSMPDIKLPAMTGMGAGLEKGIGGFDMMNDLSKMTLMGGGRSVGNDLAGTFYDLKRDRSGTPIPGMTVSEESTDPPGFTEALNRFLANNWSPKSLDKFYRGPVKLYATQFMVPPCKSYIAPPKFGIDEDIQSCLWAVHYKGKIANKTGGKFRFWGFGDDVMLVRINGKVVLNASHQDRGNIKDPGDWQSTAKEHRQYILGSSRARVGDWFTLEPGVQVEMEVLFAEGPGGTFTMMLLVQEFGVDYQKNEEGMPILPIFKTMKTPEHLIDEIKYTLTPGQADLDKGPIFSVY